jgi:Holliday junction resolvasome RuvABC ATP-dependent DNA helicase subunit
MLGVKFNLPITIYPEYPDCECIWFIEEAQKYKRTEQERIMSWIDDPWIYSSVGKVKLHIVLATTDPDKLLLPLRTRCLTFQLTPYTQQELKGMIMYDIPDMWKEQIAGRCKGIPRTADYLGETAKKYRDDWQLDIEQMFADLRIDKHGLAEIDRNYLKFLLIRGRLPLNQLASLLTVTVETVEETVEPYLKQMGWVITSSSGRDLSSSGKIMAQKIIKGE